MKNSNNKILSVAVVLLLITNIALVIFLMNGKGRNDGKRIGGGKGDPSEMMAKELGMTEQQIKEHKQLKEEHFKTIKPFYDSLRAARSAFYALIKDAGVSDSTIAAYSQRINERQAEIDKLTFNHFKRVRNLFTPEQQPKFDEFVQKMMQRSKKDSAAKGK